MCFSAGAAPEVPKGTLAIIPLVDELQDDRWEAKIVKEEGDRVQLSVNSTPTAVIGSYRLIVVTSGPEAKLTSIHQPPDYIYLLFNPWCEGKATKAHCLGRSHASKSCTTLFPAICPTI